MRRLISVVMVICAVLIVAPSCEPGSGVEIITDGEYGYGGPNQLKLDIIRPSNPPSGRMPVVVYIHGGGWVDGSKTEGRDLLEPLAERGYFCVSIDYSFTSQQSFPRQIKDAKCAIRYLRAHADYYGIDSDKIGVWGSSAGGHLAALVGTSAGADDLEGHGGWPEHSSRVQAVCDWFGPSDFVAFAQQGPSIGRDVASAGSVESLLVGGAILENQAAARWASPVTYVSPHDPPFLVVHGTADDRVPFAQSEILVAALQAKGVWVEFIPMQGAGHGGEAFEGSWLRGKVGDFFDQHLK